MSVSNLSAQTVSGPEGARPKPLWRSVGGLVQPSVHRPLTELTFSRYRYSLIAWCLLIFLPIVVGLVVVLSTRPTEARGVESWIVQAQLLASPALLIVGPLHTLGLAWAFYGATNVAGMVDKDSRSAILNLGSGLAMTFFVGVAWSFGIIFVTAISNDWADLISQESLNIAHNGLLIIVGLLLLRVIYFGVIKAAVRGERDKAKPGDIISAIIWFVVFGAVVSAPFVVVWNVLWLIGYALADRIWSA